MSMPWPVTSVPEFDTWLRAQNQDLREDIMACVLALREEGPHLGRPYVDTVTASRFPNMKELRVQHKGDPIRVLFAFDPERKAVLLHGGNKRGSRRWYDENIPVADKRFDAWRDAVKRRRETSARRTPRPRRGK